MSSVKCQKVETYVEKLFCPICDVEMKQDDLVYTSYPAKYCYFCPKCGNIEYSTIKYPNISYKEAKKNAKRN